MTECRPVTSKEAPEYLQVLCKIFDLDPARAESVFYHEPFFDLDHKWAMFMNNRIVSILTTVPLTFGDGPATGVAGVGTLPEMRGRGLALALVQASMAQSPRALLFAQAPTMYERAGFRLLDDVISAPFAPVDIDADAELLGFDEVRTHYNRWAAADKRRLIRDEKRWSFWKWNLRMCAQVGGGYICQEGDTVRECVFDPVPTRWPVFERATWFGLSSMADSLGLPLSDRRPELLFMGRGFDHVPQLFMTDQF